MRYRLSVAAASVDDPVGLESRYLTAWRLAVDFVFDYPDPPLALQLSGSVARGEADPGSDLDIFVITDGDHRRRFELAVLRSPMQPSSCAGTERSITSTTPGTCTAATLSCRTS